DGAGHKVAMSITRMSRGGEQWSVVANVRTSQLGDVGQFDLGRVGPDALRVPILAFTSKIDSGPAVGNVGSQHDMATTTNQCGNLSRSELATFFQLPTALSHGPPQIVVTQLRDRPSISTYSACACTMEPAARPFQM